MTKVQFNASPDDVARVMLAILDETTVDILDPEQEIEGPAVMLCEDMPVATIEQLEGATFTIKHLACYAPVHGSHRRWAELTERLADYNKRQNKGIICPICGGQQWLPAAGNEAKTAACFAVSLGYFRGVQLPETEELIGARADALQKSFSNLLNNPLITRVMSENRESGDDDQG